MQNDDLAALAPYAHMLTWFADDPLLAIRGKLEEWLTAQVPGSTLVWFVADDDPHWLTGGRPLDEDPSKMRLVRSGVAFAFRLLVRV